ncbi:MAG: tRNA (adenosine(37)-N6)-threonylcarbamoyltransferase complex ATPase subunit type 1 TsaE [Victivallales bacterium]|jgi:tRNA threonylcarbamoyladenosine biosynthesis protein TsaE|nr:tRNA (adenosine(37)-N6)-threonylcarbamoyltransferase complex ATPase subunit type 1 TsaE [Victivallales bacterium]
MNIKQQIITHSENETENFAAQFAQTLPRGTVVALDGDLGAGKTVFSRGFARGLGITEPVSSPTYTIVQEYPLPDSKGMLYHLDLYRIENSISALAFGVDEFLKDLESIALVEWPERISDILPPAVTTVKIRHLTDNEREITILEEACS